MTRPIWRDFLVISIGLFLFCRNGIDAVDMDASANVEDSSSYYGIGDEVKTDILVNTTGLTAGTGFSVTLTAENMEFDTSADPIIWQLTGAASTDDNGIFGKVQFWMWRRRKLRVQAKQGDYTVTDVSATEIRLDITNDVYFTSDLEFTGSINTTVNDDVKPGVILRVTVSAEITESGTPWNAEGAANTVFSKLPYFVMNITEQSSDGTVYVNVGQKVHLNLFVEFPKGTADPTIEVTLPYNFTTNKTSEQWSISKVEISSVSSAVTCTYSTEFCYYAPQTQYIANDDEYGILKDWSVTQIDGSMTMDDPDPANNILALEVEVRLDDTDMVVNGSEHWLGLGMQFGDEAHIWVGEVPVYTIINDIPEPKMSFKISYETHSFYKGDEVVILISIWHDDDSTGKAMDVKFTLLTSANIPFVSLESDYTELLLPPTVDSNMNGPTNVRIELGTIQIAATPTIRLRLGIDPNSSSTAGAHRFVGVADLVWYSADNIADLLSYTDIFQFQYSDRPNVAGDLCRDGYTPYMEACYQMHNVTVDWDAAKLLCENDDSELVIVDDEFEQQFLRSFIPVISPYKYWAGLKDVEDNDAFTWTDGSTPVYTKWLPSRPGTSSTENCGAMAFVEVYDTRDAGTELGDWDIVQCSDNLPVICEYPMFEDQPIENPAKDPVIKFSKWASSQTCSCHYDGSNQCDCCLSGAHKCEDGSHTVCVRDSSACPAPDYYDRGFIITKKLDAPTSNVIFACGPVYGRLSTKAVPACYVQDDPPDGRWKALPMNVHNVIGADETKGEIYGIHMDMRSYMRSKDHGATWEFISKDVWDSITKDPSVFKMVEVDEGGWEYNDSGLLYNSNLKMQKDCC